MERGTKRCNDHHPQVQFQGTDTRAYHQQGMCITQQSGQVWPLPITVSPKSSKKLQNSSQEIGSPLDVAGTVASSLSSWKFLGNFSVLGVYLQPTCSPALWRLMKTASVSLIGQRAMSILSSFHYLSSLSRLTLFFGLNPRPAHTAPLVM